jgi:hypothetical protein
VRSDAGGPAPTAPTPVEAPLAEPPAADDPDAATTPADGDEAPADEPPGPSAADAAPAPVEDVAATHAAASPAPAASSSTGKSTAPAKKAKAKGTSAKRSPAADLPRIDHVWVIGIGTPVTASDGGYLGGTLLARGTELPRYTPTSTDPLLGAAALVAGREPSASAKTIAARLDAAERSWRAYAPGAPSCAEASGPNPLLHFATVTSAVDCADRVAGLDRLPADLDAKGGPPAFSYVATDPALDAAGLDEQLKQVVEPIRRSAAYRRAGLIAIVPTSADPVAATGALILSPFAEGSTSVATTLGPYSLLRTFADLLGVDRPGHAGDADVTGLGPEVLVKD